jgi:hypothetical protein
VSDPEELTAQLRQLFAEHELPPDVRIGLANQRIVVRTLDLPPIDDPDEVEAAVRLQAPDHIPMPVDEAVLDYHSLGIVQTPKGDRTRVVVVAARRDMIQSVLGTAKSAGLNVVGIDLSAFAMIRALEVETTAGTAVLFINVAGLTNVAVAAGDACLFTRTAALGIESLAAELAERGSLTLEHSRQWLTHVGLDAAIDELSGDAAILDAARAVLVRRRPPPCRPRAQLTQLLSDAGELDARRAGGADRSGRRDPRFRRSARARAQVAPRHRAGIVGPRPGHGHFALVGRRRAGGCRATRLKPGDARRDGSHRHDGRALRRRLRVVPQRRHLAPPAGGERGDPSLGVSRVRDPDPAL